MEWWHWLTGGIAAAIAIGISGYYYYIGYFTNMVFK